MSGTIERITITAPDISCAHCVATVQKAVGELPGVQAVAANADTKRVEIAFDPGQLNLTQIEAAMDEAGYPVQK